MTIRKPHPSLDDIFEEIDNAPDSIGVAREDACDDDDDFPDAKVFTKEEQAEALRISADREEQIVETRFKIRFSKVLDAVLDGIVRRGVNEGVSREKAIAILKVLAFELDEDDDLATYVFEQVVNAGSSMEVDGVRNILIEPIGEWSDEKIELSIRNFFTRFRYGALVG